MQSKTKTTMKKNEKYFVYFGTEENAYEVEKSKPFKTIADAIADAKEYIDSECGSFGTDTITNFWDEKSEVSNILDSITEEVMMDGYGYEYLQNLHGYTIIIGIAKYGSCQKMRSILNEERNEIAKLF